MTISGSKKLVARLVSSVIFIIIVVFLSGCCQKGIDNKNIVSCAINKNIVANNLMSPNDDCCFVNHLLSESLSKIEEVEQTTNEITEEKPSLWSRIWMKIVGIVAFLFKMLMSIILIASGGTLLYFLYSKKVDEEENIPSYLGLFVAPAVILSVLFYCFGSPLWGTLGLLPILGFAILYYVDRRRKEEEKVQKEIERQRAEEELKRQEEIERQRAAEEERKRQEKNERQKEKARIARQKQDNIKRTEYDVEVLMNDSPFLREVKEPVFRLINAYYDAQCNILSATDYLDIKNKCESKISETIGAISIEAPISCQLNFPTNPNENISRLIIDGVKEYSKNNLIFPEIPYTYSEKSFASCYDDNHILVPECISLSNTNIAFLTNGNSEDDKVIKDNFEAYLLNVILSMPIGMVKVSVVDMELNCAINKLTSKLPNEICPKKTISSVESLNKLLDDFEAQCHEILSKYYDIQVYNANEGHVVYPYNIVVLTVRNSMYGGNVNTRLKHLIKQGRRAGIFFMVLTNEENTELLEGVKCVSINDFQSRNVPFCSKTTILSNTRLSEVAFDYIKSEIAKQVETSAAEEERKRQEEKERESKHQVIPMDYEKYISRPYEPVTQKLKVEIGISENENETAYIELDTGSYPHAFVLGKTGSGKSSFLHDIISGIELTYSPEDVQLYLLDLKQGGVEFERYKKTPHTKVLLAGCEDIEITREILRDIKKEMTNRGNMFRNFGVVKIDDYNKQNKLNTLPHIVVVIDECINIFKKGTRISHDIYDEIQEVLRLIVKEGRSQGVHLILAAQNFAGTDINSEILNNINVKCILGSSVSEASRLVEKVNDEITRLEDGKLFLYDNNGVKKVQSYYTHDYKKIIDAICEKARGHINANKFYFSGTITYHLSENNLQDISEVNSPAMVVGKKLSLDLDDAKICLRNRMSENVLVMGRNDSHQVSRTSFNMFVSTIMHAKMVKQDLKCYVLDFLEEDNKYYNNFFKVLESKGLCTVVPYKETETCLKQLVRDVVQKKKQNTLVFVVGQDRFKQLQRDDKFAETKNKKIESGFSSMLKTGSNSSVFTMDKNNNEASSYGKAFDIILNEGPEWGVHTIMQLERYSNFLFLDNPTKKTVVKRFAHIIMLKSDDRAKSWIDDRYTPSALSSESDCLRAYYYNDNKGDGYLLTPYAKMDKEMLNEII